MLSKRERFTTLLNSPIFNVLTHPKATAFSLTKMLMVQVSVRTSLISSMSFSCSNSHGSKTNLSNRRAHKHSTVSVDSLITLTKAALGSECSSVKAHVANGSIHSVSEKLMIKSTSTKSRSCLTFAHSAKMRLTQSKCAA